MKTIKLTETEIQCVLRGLTLIERNLNESIKSCDKLGLIAAKYSDFFEGCLKELQKLKKKFNTETKIKERKK